jgi:exonuclease VII large subunit
MEYLPQAIEENNEIEASGIQFIKFVMGKLYDLEKHLERKTRPLVEENQEQIEHLKRRCEELEKKNEELETRFDACFQDVEKYVDEKIKENNK